MGRRTEGATKRTALVAFRLNDEERRELEANMARHGVTEKSAYFRMLLESDRER